MSFPVLHMWVANKHYQEHLRSTHKDIDHVKNVMEKSVKIKNKEVEKIRKEAIHNKNLARECKGKH